MTVDRARSSRTRWLGLAPVVVPLAILIGTAFWGIDCGPHWDEPVMLESVSRTVQSGTLLPRLYVYPSVSYWLMLTGLTPDAGAALASGARSDTLRARLESAVRSHAYHMRVRKMFVLVSALAVLWVYLAVWWWRGHWAEAMLAACILGLSWEVGYHARWIAPDAVMMQFGALTLLCVIMAVRGPVGPGRRWLVLAAVAAGLATATKYPAGLWLLPVAIAAAQAEPVPAGLRAYARRLALLVAVFAVTYLITTPATVLDARLFVRHVTFEMQHYATGHAGYTVGAGPEHFARNLQYLGLTLLSHFPLIAGMLAVLAVAGAVDLWQESRRTALLVLSFPVVYLLYFSVQRVMIVRNLLVLTPVLAVLAARGTAVVRAAARPVWWRASVATAMAGLLVVNGAWLVHAASTIPRRDGDRFVREAAAYVDRHPDRHFVISPRVRAALDRVEPRPRLHLAAAGAAEGEALFFTDEGAPRPDWPANRFGLTTRWFGPLEINFDYYPTWQGDERIVVMPATRARALGLRP